MTLTTWTSVVSNTSSDATWRSEMTSIHNAIIAVGLVQTADTGQINLSTAVRAAVSTPVGYEIFAFNDALQATYPVYIKVEYGMGTSSNYPGIWITVGNSTDGAGTLNGYKTSRYYLSTGGTSTTGSSGVSGSTNRLTLAWYYNAGTNLANWCSIERLQDASGADTSSGFVYVQASRSAGASGNFNQVVYYSGAQPPASAYIGTLMPNMPTATTWVVGADTGTGPIVPIGWGVHPSIQGGLTYFNADLASGNTYSISTYGSAKTFLAIGSSNISTMAGLATTATILSRWD